MLRRVGISRGTRRWLPLLLLLGGGGLFYFLSAESTATTPAPRAVPGGRATPAQQNNAAGNHMGGQGAAVNAGNAAGDKAAAAPPPRPRPAVGGRADAAAPPAVPDRAVDVVAADVDALGNRIARGDLEEEDDDMVNDARALGPPPNLISKQTSAELHPAYESLLKEYPFQAVMTQSWRKVNIMLVRAAMNSRQRALFEKYKHEILFLGISSFEDFPLVSVNPFSGRYPPDEYVGLFPGFLHMMREPEKYFPSNVRLILMSQSDFNIPDVPPKDYSVKRPYDFAYSGSDQDVRNDCVGWSSFAKNWSFVKEALEVMCGEFEMTGVLVATKDKKGVKACTIPKSCEGKIVQTTFLDQNGFFGYLRQSKFLFLPQIHDASPRVATQAMGHDLPLLMNSYISGGWKYLNEKTGEFFHDMSDFRQQLRKILDNSVKPGYYEPRQYIRSVAGNVHSGKRLLRYIEDNFSDVIMLPEGTTALYI